MSVDNIYIPISNLLTPFWQYMYIVSAKTIAFWTVMNIFIHQNIVINIIKNYCVMNLKVSNAILRSLKM